MHKRRSMSFSSDEILRLKKTIDKYKEELHKLKDGCNVSTFFDVVTDSQ